MPFANALLSSPVGKALLHVSIVILGIYLLTGERISIGLALFLVGASVLIYWVAIPLPDEIHGMVASIRAASRSLPRRKRWLVVSIPLVLGFLCFTGALLAGAVAAIPAFTVCLIVSVCRIISMKGSALPRVIFIPPFSHVISAEKDLFRRARVWVTSIVLH